MRGYALALGQAGLCLALAPGLVGLIRWLKARMQNRRGAPVWQPYLELRKLFAKEVVVSTNASWLFRLAPYVVFTSTLAVTCSCPSWRCRCPSTGSAISWWWCTCCCSGPSSSRSPGSTRAPRSEAWDRAGR